MSPWRFSRLLRHSDVIVSVYANFNCKITISNMTWRKVEAIFLSEFGQIAINFHQSMDLTHTCNHESALTKFQICSATKTFDIYHFITLKQKNNKRVLQNVLLFCKFQVISYCFPTSACDGSDLSKKRIFSCCSLRNYCFDWKLKCTNHQRHYSIRYSM